MAVREGAYLVRHVSWQGALSHKPIASPSVQVRNGLSEDYDYTVQRHSSLNEIMPILMLTRYR